MRRVWMISDGSAGMRAQLRGMEVVLQSLGPWQADYKIVHRKKPYVWLPNAIAPLQLTRKLTPPWPDAIISCGRRSAVSCLAVARATKRAGKSCAAIHIGDPQGRNNQFDAIIAPQHDKLGAKNVIETVFALHGVTHEMLFEARQKFLATKGRPDAPVLSILVGGNTNRYILTPRRAQALCEHIRKICDGFNGHVWITTSRRTGEKVEAQLSEVVRECAHVSLYTYEQAGLHNPYIQMLAMADWIAVTDDSVNMMSEAIFTGKPVYIIPLPEHSNTKPAKFAEQLIAGKSARLWKGVFESWSASISDERPLIAEKLHALLPNYF